MDKDLILTLRNRNISREQRELRDIAQKSEGASRIFEEKKDYRPSFSRDADRIIHSLSYHRFMNKTQVFFWVESDIHQRRLHHVHYVARIGREIGRALGLNEDLIEAIALGHDIGHVPFGHDGETILNEITLDNQIGRFFHNMESVHFLQNIEMQNLTLPVVDGILCHNGEKHHRILKPELDKLSWDQHESEMNRIVHGTCKEDWDPLPKTLEGALIRVVDTISYISRDVLDAQNLGYIQFSDIPDEVKNVLGDNNRAIINTLINDLIICSVDNDYIAYSKEVHDALLKLYEFNYKNIYTIKEKLNHLPIIREAFYKVWDYYLKDMDEIKKNINYNSRIFKQHLQINLNTIKTRYPQIDTLDKYDYFNYDPRIIVRDFLAGSTDKYFWELVHEIDPNLKIEQLRKKKRIY